MMNAPVVHNADGAVDAQEPSNQSQGDDNASTDYACNECRRRKARCTRELPVCSVCSKTGRHCLYERHSRSPLTRKHLTEVEELLRIATQIIRHRLPEVDLQLELERSRNGESEYDVDHERQWRAEDGAKAGTLKRPRLSPSHQPVDQATPDSRYPDPGRSSLHETHIECLTSSGEGDRNNLHQSDMPPIESLDPLSPEHVDYDWDERHSEAPFCLDGMASLSLHDEKPGYLGLASGAALLNLIQSYTSDPFASLQPLHYAAAEPEIQSLPPQIPVNLKKEIPSHKISQYISDYFDTFHVSYPLVHQGLFMAQYNEIIPRPRVGWLVLMYTIAAIGAFMAAASPNNDDVVLFHLARSHLSFEMLEIGNLTLVQSLTLISNYLQKRDRPNSGYNYLGLAVRMAFALGLHKEFPNWKGNLLQAEMRRRVWWCLYIFDAGSTITYSRPLGIPSTGIDARLPLNTCDSDLNAASTTYPENDSIPTIYTNVRVQSQFHLLTNTLYNRIISKPCPSAREVLAWDDEYIGKWLHSVPTYYKDDATIPEKHSLAHAIMIWRYKNLRMILYRPFLIQKVLLSSRNGLQTGLTPSVERRSGSSEIREPWTATDLFMDQACNRCRQESTETIRHIDWHRKTHSHTRMASWYALFFLFPAVLVPLISLRNEPQSPLANNWRDDISLTIEVIKSMVDLIPTAARLLRVLEKLSTGFLPKNPSQFQFSDFEQNLAQQPIEESPISQMISIRSLMFPDDPLYGIGRQVLYEPGECLEQGVAYDEFNTWTSGWPNNAD